MSALASPPAAAPLPAAPHELVLASAGSGKTYWLSSRIIALLAHGAPPEQVLASTFTRKAAGEILDRVLRRLAEASLGEEAAAELSEAAALEGGEPPLRSPGEWGALLREVTRRLHRTSVGTLDAYFVGAARAFGHELELPPGWAIADEPTLARLRSEALQQVLARADAGEVAELLRLVQGGDARRSVHDILLKDLEGLLEIHEGLHPGAPDPWGAFAAEGAPVPGEARARLAAAIRALPRPVTQKGTPRVRWQKALDGAAEAVETGDWLGLLAAGPCGKLLEGSELYDGAAITGDTLAALREALELAAAHLRPRLAARARALGALTADYAAELSALQYRRGAYRFADLTRLVGGPDPLLGRPELYYRLDAVAQHLLLDEFQDTSRAQWEALHPLFDEAAQSAGRAAVVVADPKQSIYGWRGAEPGVVHALGDHYRLEERTLARSWRSSPEVLGFVNRVFGGIADHPLLADDDTCRRVAAVWARDFEAHTARWTEKPGYVAVEAGPRDPGLGSQRPLLCRCAAERVKELHERAPAFSIGVLTRKNAGVARMILELRDLGVEASEEGGTPLADSAAVEAVLAALRLADHPGDRIARYHVARSPLGGVLGLPDPDDARAVHLLSRVVRAALLREGYGALLHRWAGEISPRCSARERRRLRQLVELGFRYEAEATLRPADFVRRVESERVESPTRAGVRVMTVHQAKGLEFDVVVLPELDDALFRPVRAPAYPWRPEPGGRITAVYPPSTAEERCLFPELVPAYEQAREAGIRDGLSGLYVALTRARYALHLVVRADREDGEQGSGLSAARLVRATLGVEGPAREGELIHESGDAEWYLREGAVPEAARGGAPAEEAPAVRLRTPDVRRRILPRSTPSGMEGGSQVELASLLRLDTRAALDRGSVLHRWFESIGWIEEGVPDEEELRRLAGELAPNWGEEELGAALAAFRAALRTPAIHDALSRAAYPAGAVVEREVPFVWREPGAEGRAAGLLEGVIDRLVVVPGGEGIAARAEVLDFKTDSVRGNEDLLRERVAHYAPQLRAYREAVAGMYRLPPAAVEGRLLFLDAGRVETPG